MSQFNCLHSSEDLEEISHFISMNKPYRSGSRTRPATVAQNYSTVQKQELIMDELETRIFNTEVQRIAALDSLLKDFGRKERPLENALFEQERKKAALEASLAENSRILRARLISSAEYAEMRAVIYVAEQKWKVVQAKVEFEMKDLKARTEEAHERLTGKYKSTLAELEGVAENARRVRDQARARIDEDVRWYRAEQASALRGKCQRPF